MRVAIDISPIRGLHQFRGIGVYTKLLVKALQEYDTDNEYILTTKSYLANVDLIHYPFFDLFFLTLPIIKLKPTLVTIHDVHPLIFPKQFKPGLRGKLKHTIQRQSLKGVKAILTDSDCSKQDIINYLKVPKAKIHRVYLAANPAYKPRTYAQQKIVRDRYDLRKPYFLYVGDINFNKNVPYLVQNYWPYAKDFDLVIVSRAMKITTPEAQAIRQKIETLKLKQNVKLVTDLGDNPAELGGIYSGAFWYIQPSLYEGFGLPVVEAMQCGVPVICSRGGSLPEIAAPSSLSFDPNEAKALELVLAKVMVMTKAERKHYIDLGLTQVKKFTWEKTALATIKVYRQVLGL